MPSIKQRDDGVWRARYRDATGREHARHFKLKRDAQRWLEEVSASVVTGQYVDPRAGRVTFREYAEGWRASQVHRKQTADSYESRLRRHVYPVIGSMPLASIRPSTIQGLVKRMSTEGDGRAALAPSTVELTYKVVSTIFKAAVRDKRLSESPCIDVRLPKAGKTRATPLTLEQVATLRDTVPDELRALIVLVAGTGLRPGEALGVTRDRVRLLGRNPAVTVDRQLVTRAKGTAEFGPLKTEASDRVVPLPRVVVAALNEHIAAHEIADDGLLFTYRGQPITRPRFWHLFAEAREAAGLTEATGTGLHALRHYYASLLIRFGESVKTVQARLGHASATETLDTYSHLWPDSDDRTRDAVDSVLLADSADSLRTTRHKASGNT
ncbi:site-specific integrase [Microbacterium sp. C7(2022)]|uniref:tyrosine-type recombinase/integrase n=1 Tax=Microbacterium sp. C7(2022) TaxID=2992759 RepID=UPI00237A5959|nr:site-specific integrase [Microbacterium sp. C7(2022)]MDE0545437.1 site-specific integrase [Microbacterium sp. C7(2022)]